ncbi:MAG TPA: signal peptidase I [Candidatus Azoamicus sp. OHIO2]
MDKKILYKDYFELLIIIILVMLVRFIVIEPFRIPSASMKPTLITGDFIFAHKFIYALHVPFVKKCFNVTNPQRGDIIIFYNDNIRYVKRLIGVVSDLVVYKKKTLYLNNIRVKKKKIVCQYSYSSKKKCLAFEYLTPKNEYIIKIKNKHYSYENDYVNKKLDVNYFFVLGDNRDNSHDSRVFGFVDRLKVRGKVIIIWISFDFYKIDLRWNRFLNVVI